MNICSLKDYLDLFNYFFYALHPAIFIAAIIGIFCIFKKLSRNHLVRFLFILLVFDVLLKIFKFYKTGVLTERYLLITVFSGCVFASIGIYHSSSILFKLIKEKNVLEAYRINREKIFCVIVIIISVIMIGQILKPNFDKPWINGIKYDIQRIYSGDKIPIVITNGNDSRIGYVAKAKMLKLNMNTFSIRDSFKMLGQVNSEFVLKFSIANFQQYLKLLGGKNVFVFLEKVNSSELEKKFKDRNIFFPLKLIKTYYRGKKEYCLFQYFD
jgi:hypothetical protein